MRCGRAGRMKLTADTTGRPVRSSIACRVRAMIWPVSSGCWPPRARRLRTRWMLSAVFSHDPPSGVNSGITPWANSHSTSAGVL